MNALPNQKYLQECFRFDSDTGALIWRHRPQSHFSNKQACSAWNTRFEGKDVGTRGKFYQVVTLDGMKYYAHRLVWVLVKGSEPITLDHINGDRYDNRFINLREASPSESSRNLPKTRKNTSGVVGVSRITRSGKWLAHIKTDGVMTRLGSFESFDAAVAARKEAEIDRGFHPNHGRELIHR